MKHAIAKLQSISPYSQSKPFLADEKKQSSETHEAFDARMWRHRIHFNPDTKQVFVPPMSLKNAMSEAAKYLSISVPGKGKATYTKCFEAGVMVGSPVELFVPPDKPLLEPDVEMEKLFVPASGKRGDGSRVWRHFPLIRSWTGECVFTIIDETVLQKHEGTDKTVFQHVLEQAGQLIGIGRFRPKNNGYYGRFKVVGFRVEDIK